MRKIILLISLLLFLPFASALIESYNSDFTMSLSKVFVSQKIVLGKKGNFSLQLPGDASDISLVVDNKTAEYSEHIFGKEIKVEYITGAFIERKNFIAEITFPDDIKNLSLRVFLPANSVLRSMYDAKTKASDSIFPKPSGLATDGQRIIISWSRENLKKGESLPVLVKFRDKNDYTYLIYILIVVVIALLVYIILRKPRIKTRTIIRKEDLVEKHLKEDEEQVVNILKQRENQCEQGTLRVITGFSKAKLSGLLKELEDRKVIFKEKRGKKNLVFLKR